MHLQVTAERMSWPKFGHAAVNNQGVTVRGIDEIQFERTNLPKKTDQKKSTDFGGSLASGDKREVRPARNPDCLHTNG